MHKLYKAALQSRGLSRMHRLYKAPPSKGSWLRGAETEGLFINTIDLKML